MNKKIVILLSLFFAAAPLYAVQFAAGTKPLVDGVYNSTQAVITSHQPLFSWEFDGNVSSFTVIVSTDAIFDPSGELWDFVGATNTLNTINNITRVQYGQDGSAAALGVNSVYYWQVTLYDGAGGVSDGGQFTTTSAAANPSGEKYDLSIDWNNPFNPSKDQVTKFRFGAMDRDRKLKLRIFTVSGVLVAEWPEQTAIKDAIYTITWDGRNSSNETVARGIYLINLMDVGENQGVTRKVAVINGK